MTDALAELAQVEKNYSIFAGYFVPDLAQSPGFR